MNQPEFDKLYSEESEFQNLRLSDLYYWKLDQNGKIMIRPNTPQLVIT